MKKQDKKQKLTIYIGWALIVVGLLFLANALKAQSNYPQMVTSKDGTLISNKVYGK